MPECHVCGKNTVPTKDNRYRKHQNPTTKEECPTSGTFIPTTTPEASCRNDSTPNADSQTAPYAGSSPAGAKATAPPAIHSIGSSPSWPGPAAGVSDASARPALPGVEGHIENLNGLATAQLEAYRAAVDSKLKTKFSQPAPTQVVQPTIFSQPAGRPSAESTVPMTELGKTICATFDAIFYAYQNRKADDNRSAQATMGPSEAGSPCDRRLAMSLMKVPAVNPGGDRWRAFIGTQIHEGLEEVFSWANANTGRFATEMKLTFPSEFVPKGTGDLLDRTLYVFEDFKCMSEWSLTKLKTKGPSITYLRQVMLYGYAARLRGEKVDYVCILGLPADGKSLDEKYAWTAPYDPKIALDALARVERIAGEVEQRRPAMADLDVAGTFTVAPDCRYCDWYMPNAKSLISGGCNGRQ